MVSYNFAHDLLLYRKLKNLSQENLSFLTGISRVTIARAETGAYAPSKQTLESFYSYLYLNGFNINEIKNNLLEDNKKDSIVLYHGAKKEIKSDIDTEHSDEFNDFGKAFYANVNYDQAATWVFDKIDSSVYAFYLNNISKLSVYEFGVDEDWMIAILYFRKRIAKYENCKKVKTLLEKLKGKDLIIAPIADNMMYNILNKFAAGEITNEQCLHALAANNLGKQYVFLNNSACKHLVPKDRLFLSRQERFVLENSKKDNFILGKQKAEVSLIEYRRKGKFIDEFFID